MKKIIALVCIGAMFTNANAAQFECETSGKITYQDESCNASLCMSNQKPTDVIELFDKISISKLRINKGRVVNESTEMFFEIDAINDSKNKVKLTIKYDGIDKDGFTLDNQTIIGTIESYSKIRIQNNDFLRFKNTKLVNKIVQWRFNSWSAEINK